MIVADEPNPSLDRCGGERHIDVALGLLAVVILILLNGFYVAGEFALVAANRTKVEALAQEGHRGAISTLAGLKTLSFQLSGAQLGITITSLLVGFILEPTLGEALQGLFSTIGLPTRTSVGLSVGLALAIATASQMVFGELVPKNLAIAKPLQVAFKVTTPLRVSNAIFKPLIVFLNASANATVRLLGVEPQEELAGARSLEELEILIRSSREGGGLGEAEYSLLSRSISFGDKTAADALLPRTSMVTLQAQETVSDLVEESLKTGHSRFPITGDDLDDIVGIAHIKDIYATPIDARATTPVTAIAQDVMFTPESRDLKSLLIDMRRDRKQMAVVVDEFGGTEGIITIEDLLEEIVGEIEDEYDPTFMTPELAQKRSGVNVVDGLLRPDELKEITGLELPEGDFDTFAGFLLTLFDRIPRKGEHCSFEGWEFKVTEMDRNRIARVLVVAPPPRLADDEDDR